ncbi:MAG: ribosomal RNA small subunit methyltransferase A [Planctomycetes bacterium]|nr:ribosomal RNA small subunit methyltransferase A [Planctomycetota bacterium]
MPSGNCAGWQERHPRQTLKRHGIRARRRLGQSFLVSPEAMDRIVDAADVSSDEVALEIGTGLGRLSARLAARARTVISVEIDGRLHEVARRHLREFANVRLLREDFLESKHSINPAVTEAGEAALQGSAGPLKVVSNLPYCISSPAVVNLLEWDFQPRSLYLTLQREVAERMLASPGARQYGPLTVYVDYWATVRALFALGRDAFWPAPAVSSTVVEVVCRPSRRRDETYEKFAVVVRKLFGQRRKMLRGALRRAWDREVAEHVLKATGLDPDSRAEGLATDDFLAIAEAAPDSPR